MFSGKVSKSDIVQSIGTSTTAVMSQKAVTKISHKVDELDDKVKELNEEINIESGEENNDHNSGPECVIENNENDPKITKIYKKSKNVD